VPLAALPFLSKPSRRVWALDANDGRRGAAHRPPPLWTSRVRSSCLNVERAALGMAFNPATREVAATPIWPPWESRRLCSSLFFTGASQRDAVPRRVVELPPQRPIVGARRDFEPLAANVPNMEAVPIQRKILNEAIHQINPLNFATRTTALFSPTRGVLPLCRSGDSPGSPILRPRPPRVDNGQGAGMPRSSSRRSPHSATETPKFGNHLQNLEGIAGKWNNPPASPLQYGRASLRRWRAPRNCLGPSVFGHLGGSAI
jgi:hypothetical protein